MALRHNRLSREPTQLSYTSVTYKENYIRILTRENKWHSADYQDATARLVVGCLCELVFFPGCAPLGGEGL